jgi:S1-C subfamily serine protease
MAGKGPIEQPDASTFSGDQAAPKIRIMSEVEQARKVTDLRGRTCKVQPGENQIPVLEPGKPSNGCSYKDLDHPKDPKNALPFNTKQLYEQAGQQAWHFESRLKNHDAWFGSGVAIGKDAHSCFVATDNHVLNGLGFDKRMILSRQASQAGSEKKYNAEPVASDPAKDLAIAKVNTGPDTDKVCHPAVVAEDPTRPGPGAVVGFPEGSKSLYYSPATIRGARPLAEILKEERNYFPPGTQDFKRSVLDLVAQTRDAYSGGATYNANDEVVGLLAGGVFGPHKYRISQANILSRRILRKLLPGIQQ